MRRTFRGKEQNEEVGAFRGEGDGPACVEAVFMRARLVIAFLILASAWGGALTPARAAGSADLEAHVYGPIFPMQPHRAFDIGAVVKNNGPAAATATFAVTLPSGVTFASLPGNCTSAAGTATCTSHQLAAEEEETALLYATANAPGSYTVTMHVSGDVGDQDLTNNDANAVVQIRPDCHVTVTLEGFEVRGFVPGVSKWTLDSYVQTLMGNKDFVTTVDASSDSGTVSINKEIIAFDAPPTNFPQWWSVAATATSVVPVFSTKAARESNADSMLACPGERSIILQGTGEIDQPARAPYVPSHVVAPFTTFARYSVRAVAISN